MLDPVVHQQTGQAGVQVHSDHIAPAQPAQEGRVLSPAAHMVGQTAKGLHGQNPVTAGMDVGGALGSDEPSVSHPQGLADPVRRLPLKGGKGGQAVKPVGCQGRRHGPLEPRHPGAQAPPQGLDGPRRSGDLTADIVENVPGEAIHRHLTARLLQKGEDVPVAQGAVFGVELPHQGHPLPGHRPAGQGGKVPGGLVKDFLHPAEGHGGAAA